MPRALPPAQPELPEPSTADAALLRSFGYHLRSTNLSDNTRAIYETAARLHARWAATCLDHDLDEATRTDIKAYVIWMKETARKRNGEPFSEGYINNQFRALQQFYKWLAEDEGRANPTAGMTPPKIHEKLVPVVGDAEIEALLARYENKPDFDSRRNYAMIRLFLWSGVRLAELTNIKVGDIHLDTGSARVLGKGKKERMVKFDPRTIKALDKYIRTRAKHKMSKLDQLWLGSNQRPPLTPNGIRQCVRKAAQNIGFHLYPHMFRHTFAHHWLDAGGSEGDLMELMGWSSPQMLRRYGASAKAARAQRAYDRVDLFRGR
jgi:site-specific recombinase XerD